jgi:hypothetical protein
MIYDESEIPEELKQYFEPTELGLESKFQEGMSWENHGKFGWHIDHVRPASSFKFHDDNGIINIEEVEKCLALENLQPLWCEENYKKGDKIL